MQLNVMSTGERWLNRNSKGLARIGGIRDGSTIYPPKGESLHPRKGKYLLEFKYVMYVVVFENLKK